MIPLAMPCHDSWFDYYHLIVDSLILSVTNKIKLNQNKCKTAMVTQTYVPLWEFPKSSSKKSLQIKIKSVLVSDMRRLLLRIYFTRKPGCLEGPNQVYIDFKGCIPVYTSIIQRYSWWRAWNKEIDINIINFKQPGTRLSTAEHVSVLNVVFTLL